MSLRDYQKKRSFDKTPEPKGETKQTTGALTFVIQKHVATRLHYDFRLELNGVLVSWAIPKGPSLNPKEKRLAMHVEDHPMEYANFEGIIPKGNYGAGTVMVWDKGVYSPLAFVDRNQAEVMLAEQLEKGDLKFVLLGEKVRGEFALVKTHGREENAWLLIKKHDEYATEKDILLKDTSVLTDRAMEEIKNQAQRKQEIWHSKPQNIDLYDSKISTMPHAIKPMLAQSVMEPFDNEDWIFELKYDGYRAIAEIESGNVTLYSRNNISYNNKFALLADSLKKFPGNAVLDGEVVVVDEKGHPQFQWLQDYPKSKKGELLYFVFDVLYYEGHDLTKLPLYKRKEILKQILPPLPHIIYADNIDSTGIEMFRQAKKLGIEGIMAKKKESVYTMNERSIAWLKIKTQKRQEVVIAGFTKPNGGRKYFGSLITGIYKGGKLIYTGHVGGGFDDTLLESIYLQLKPLQQTACPFETKPKTNTPATWVQPKLLAEVTFSQWTNDNQMRHPVFLGLREDKHPSEVKEEKYFEPEQINKSTKKIMIGKQELALTNLDKIFWPQEKYKKGDLIQYYREIAPVILPYLKDRPESLLRYPNGITGESFYQKDAKLLDVDWIKTTSIFSHSNKKHIEYLLCQDEATLVYLINLGCIDLNPWSSRVGNLDKPDYLLIDLDPEGTDFKNVVTTALAFREVLEALDIVSYPKTSGAKGMHIYIPLGAEYSYEQSRQLAQILCLQVNNKIPELTSMKRNPKDRIGLVYLDYLQNIQGQTLASVYSVRAQSGATVSAPLHWSEVTSKLHPSQFTIKNMPERMQKEGDIFKKVLGIGIDMKKILEKMSVSNFNT